MRARSFALTVAILIGSSLAAAAGESCAPISPGATILRTKDVTDIHPDWVPPNKIGTSWSLVAVRHEGKFLSGRLVTPRGGTQRRRIYVIASEWDCGN